MLSDSTQGVVGPSELTGAGAANAFRRAMTVHGVRMTYERNEEVYAQDDEVELLYQVVAGVVRTSRLTVDGRRQVGDFYYPGDLFGLEPGPDHRFGAEALEDCEILVVRRSAVRAAVGDAELDRAILEAQRVEMERLQDHVVMLGRKSAMLVAIGSFVLATGPLSVSGNFQFPQDFPYVSGKSA